MGFIEFGGTLDAGELAVKTGFCMFSRGMTLKMSPFSKRLK
jgi:hypothetical protein